MLVHPQFNPVAVSFGPWQVAGHELGPFAWSYDGLSAEAQSLFRRCGIFAGRFTALIERAVGATSGT